MKGKFIVYALVVSLVTTMASWGKVLSGNSFGGSGSRSGSSWSSTSGGSSWGSGGGGGGHK
jgi:hypothetical protein